MFRTKLSLDSVTVESAAETLGGDQAIQNTSSFGQYVEKGVRRQTLKGFMTSGIETIGKYKSKIAEPTSPKKLNVPASQVAANTISLNTRGYFVQSEKEKTTVREELQGWNPLKDVQGADPTGEGAVGGMDGLREKNKNITNAAPLQVYDYRINSDHLGQNSVKLRSKAVHT